MSQHHKSAILSQFFGKSRESSGKASKSYFPAVERLECRELMAANTTVTYLPDYKFLLVRGTEQADQISIQKINGQLSMGGNIPISTPNGNVSSLNADSVEFISIATFGSNDTILLNTESTPGNEPIKIRTAIDAGAGDDVVVGGATKDQIRGGPGVDAIWGQKGFDVIHGDGETDYLDGGDGDDRIFGDGGDDWLYGQNNRDVLIGGIGNDHLYGGDGRDALIALYDNDYLNGGGHSDRLLVDSSVSMKTQSKDAVMVFSNGSAMWTEGDLEILDEGFRKLHSATNNTRLLKDTNGGQLRFIKEQPNSSWFGLNTQSGLTHKIQIVDWDESSTFYNEYAATAAIHEIGHNWDEASELRAVGIDATINTGFLSVSWSNPQLQTVADFADQYGMASRNEDWATMCQAALGYYDRAGKSSKFYQKLNYVDQFFEAVGNLV